MPEVKNVSPVLPVAAATPVQGSSSNAAVSQGNDGQPAFSQVLRDKQAAANASANAKANSSNDSGSKVDDAGKAAAKDGSDKAGTTDNKIDAAQKDSAADAAASAEAIPKTPAEMAQLLAAAGLMATAQTNTTAPDTTSDSAAADQLAIDTANKTATDPNVLAALPKTDKTAAADTAAAASLAAGTATTTSSVEQALASQSQSSQIDNRNSQPGTSSGDQQPADRQPLLAVESQGNTDKTAAIGTDSEASFSAALERANQNGSTPLTSVVTQTQSSQAPAATHTITTPVGRQGWADEVGQRVLWTAKSDSSRADLVLTPPQLGRIEVSIHVNGDQATASFMAANPVAREALQDAMPKLRELMSQAGIQLGQADVSAGQSGQNGTQGERRQAGGGGGLGMLGSDGAIGGTASGWTRQGTGLVDTFA